MKGRFTAFLTVVALLCAATSGWAQVQTGEIFGRVTDNTGAILPGATVTLSGPALLQPLTAITGETGAYQFPRIPIGTYTVKFELPGFKTLVREGVRVELGFNAQINAQLEISAVQETVTVTGESPVVDTRTTAAQTTFNLETLQNIPSARDPWVMLERTPAMTMDRVNVGGNQSGQQSGFISRGAAAGNNKWSIDGVDITDMSATGASPIYYDFDMLEELQVTTGGPDASQQTGGVGINMVTRSGTDRFKGSGRVYVTDDDFEADNVTPELRAQGAGSGAPIQNIQDYGFEVGGPIAKGKAWYWGSYGTQDIKVGVVGFYKDTATCRPPGLSTAQIGQTLDTDTLRSCLETDLTTLNNYNWKIQYAPFQGNKFAFQNTWAEKVRNARGASDTMPIETTFRQKAVSSEFGATGWTTGPSPLWKASDQHIINDRMMIDVQWAHLGNNFVLDFHEDSLKDVQPRLETSTGVFGRSFQQSVFLRPTQSVDVNTNYFLPGTLGGDHALKAGFRWRAAHSLSTNHRGGNTYARYTNNAPNSAELWRDGRSESDLQTYALYVQDTFTVRRLTLNLGVRWDRQDDEALAADVPAHPFLPSVLPAVSFPGADVGVVWNDISPRLGLTYDLAGTGKTVARASYAMYYGQMAPGQLSGELAATGAVFVRYPWRDLNSDEFVQANEVTVSANPLSRSNEYDPRNPSGFLSPGTVDPNIKNDRTREFIVGFDHELAANLGIGASYIWRKYDQFNWADTLNFGSENYRSVTFNPTCSAASARCETVTYFEPTIQIPSPYLRTNVPDRWRDYNGVEFTVRKRYANRWMGNFSVAYNDAADHFDSAAAYEDPTCRTGTDGGVCPAGQIYAPELTGSGQGGVFTNAKWLTKASGMYTLPLFDIGVSGNLIYRQGYPFPQSITTPNRANGAGTAQVLLDPLGDVRLPDVYTLDLGVNKTFTFNTVRIVPTLDVFNVTNVNTVLVRARNQAGSTANNVSGIIAPRVLRFGVRVNW